MDSEDSNEGEDNVPDSEETTGVTSVGQITRALGSTISSVLSNIGSAISKAPLANSAIKLSRVPDNILILKRFAQELVKLSTESEDSHRKMSELAKYDYNSLQYYRFNVPAGMEEFGIEEWKKIPKMGALTRSYLATPSVETDIEECTKSLSNPTLIASTQFL